VKLSSSAGAGGAEGRPLFTCSSLSSFNYCPRQYYWGYLRRVRPRTYAPRILLGNAIHEVLEKLYVTRSVAAATITAERHESVRTAEWWRATIAGYFQTYAREIIDAVDAVVEEEFRIPLPSGIDFGGRLDLALGESLFDHKSTGVKDPNRWARNRSWEQLYAYAFALTTGGRTISTLTYNVVLAEQKGPKRFHRISRPVDPRELDIIPVRIQGCANRILDSVEYAAQPGGRCRACFYSPLCDQKMGPDASDEALLNAGFNHKARQHEELSSGTPHSD
jgi:CRISPR/Cas system-associated exonuclease Cas4 (RecB family)